MKELKAEGKIRQLGFSSHNPDIARRLLDTGLVNIFMFSINPAYEYQKGSYTIGELDERTKLYLDSERMGVGITVLKLFAGGQLLDSKVSPFQRSLTKNKCMQFALDCPAVLIVLPGVRNMIDLLEVLEYNNATDEEKDYSIIGEFTPPNAHGVFVYCNHCQSCPIGLNIIV